MKIIAIIGEPGSGKTTLMKKLISELDIKGFDDSVKLVPFHADFKENKWISILGIYDDKVFGGTDRMSMACQPNVIEWIKEIDYANYIILFEGDRLGNSSFLEFCANNYNLNIIYLNTEKEIREQRYQDRGSNQNQKWLDGRKTKINNILKNFLLVDYIHKVDNNNLVDQEKIIEYIKGLIIDE